jgi:hypothetical protein
MTPKSKRRLWLVSTLLIAYAGWWILPGDGWRVFVGGMLLFGSGLGLGAVEP